MISGPIQMFAFALKKQKNTQKWQVYVRNHVTHFCKRLKELAYYSMKSLIYQNPSGTPEKILTPLWQVNSLQWLATIKSKSFLESHLDFDKWAISWNNRQVLLVCHKNEWRDFWHKPGIFENLLGPVEHFQIKWGQAYGLVIICPPYWNRVWMHLPNVTEDI